MRRRTFIAGLGSAAAWPLAARAQPIDRVPSVGFLMGRAEDDPENRAERDAFEQGLAKLGWIAGGDIHIEYRWSSGDDARIRSLAAELVAKSPRVIVTYGTQAALILKQQTSVIPIVFLNVADPIESGLVASFAHPGGNVTGFTALEFSLGGKWLSLLKEISPRTTRVLVLYTPDNSNWTGYLRAIEAAASSLSVNVTASATISAEEIERAVEAFGRSPEGGIIVVPSGLMGVNRDMIASLAIRHRLPSIYPYRYYAVSGGLVSYGSDTVDLYRRAPSYVDRILKGEKPGDLPIQAPTKFEFVVNLMAAKAIGITVPQPLQLLADEVIE
jgi:putative ABC transport system substrate-binding protein